MTTKLVQVGKSVKAYPPINRLRRNRKRTTLKKTSWPRKQEQVRRLLLDDKLKSLSLCCCRVSLGWICANIPTTTNRRHWAVQGSWSSVRSGDFPFSGEKKRLTSAKDIFRLDGGLQRTDLQPRRSLGKVRSPYGFFIYFYAEFKCLFDAVIAIARVVWMCNFTQIDNYSIPNQWQYSWIN